MSRRVAIDHHGNFQADVRQRLAATTGEPDPAELAREIHAKAIERVGQRRNKREASRVLDILDQLNREEKTR